LVALADADSTWARAFEHRFRSGELEDHALGNLIIVGLAESMGRLSAALDESARLLGAAGRVLPATTEPVAITANVGARNVVGQVAVAEAGESDRIRDVQLMPADAPADPDALKAINDADQIVWAPGSLYTSIVAVVCVPEIRDAVAKARAQVVQVANLVGENETVGLDGTDHLAAVRDHDGRVDIFLYDAEHGLAVDAERVRELGAEPRSAALATGEEHDPAQLARALAALL
jgi:uncharacterized cofD-like protein